MRYRLVVVIILAIMINSSPVSADFPHTGTYLGLDSQVAENYNQFDNKVVLIEAFATWCLPCKSEQHELSLVDNTFNSDQENLTIFTLSVSPGTDDLDKIQTFKSDAEDEFDFVATWEYGLDTREGDKDNFAEAFEITVIPTTLLIGVNGVVMQKWEGVVTASTIIGYIDSNIEFEAPNQSTVFLKQVLNNLFFKGFLLVLIVLIIYRALIPRPNLSLAEK